VTAVAYEPFRLAVGLGVAALLLAVGGWLIRSTDWSPPDGDPLDKDERG
jgi:hypothetical protein